jgi:hypothetical protein
MNRVAGIGLAFLLALMGGAGAQPAPPRPADPLFAGAEQAFLALDPEARKAIQRDLVWVAGFTGSATGDFGPLTFAALKRFEGTAKLKADAILTPPERAALQKAADAARLAIRFEVITDKASGMRIGLPQAIFVKSAPNNSGGTRFQDKDEKVTLETIRYKPEDQLADLFEKGIAERPGRKITYKLIRPDFFVISGETAGGKFFRRVESDGRALRGLSIGYDKALAASFDTRVIAIASTFEAFPRTAGPSGPDPALIAAGPRQRRATGIVVEDGMILASEAALKGCAEIVAIGPKGERIPARGEKPPSGGLVMLAARAGAPITAHAHAPMPGAATLLQRDEAGDLTASAATITNGKVEASLQEGGAGAALFDRAGNLVGILAAEPVTKFRVAGIMPALSYAFVPAPDALVALARAGGVAQAATGTMSAAAIAEANRAGILALLCASDR